MMEKTGNIEPGTTPAPTPSPPAGQGGAGGRPAPDRYDRDVIKRAADRAAGAKSPPADRG